MKRILIIVAGLVFVSGFLLAEKADKPKDPESPQGITLVTSPDLAGLTSHWINEYTAAHPGTDIRTRVLGSEPLIHAEQAGIGMGLVSENYLSSMERSAYLEMLVGREVFVAVFHSGNPLAAEIGQKGIRPEMLGKLLLDPRAYTLGALLGVDRNVPVHYYMVKDAAVQKAVSHFLRLGEELPAGITSAGTDEMIRSLQNDPNGMAFLRLTDLLDENGQMIAGNIALLPIDRNGNGQLDYYENIYSDVTAFQRGVWIGKYPQELINNIYSLSPLASQSAAGTEFVKWMLTEGQQYLMGFGYSDLLDVERAARFDRLSNLHVVPESADTGFSGVKAIVMVLLALIIVAFVVEAIILYYKSLRTEKQEKAHSNEGIFNEKSVHVPKGLFYDKTHTWAYMEQDGLVKVGLDDFLTQVTGKLSRLEMKKNGTRISKGEVILSLIQDGKQLDIKSPVSGTIRQLNASLKADASLVNSSNYQDGWVYRIEPSNWLREIQFMLMADKFREWIRGEFLRLKDFVTQLPVNGEARPALLVMQEGGEIREGLLSDFGPSVWEDFQTQFIETTA